MKQIQGIGDAPKQQTTLTLADGTQVSFYLEYKPQQLGWFYDIAVGNFSVTGQRLVTSTNLLNQYRNQVSFGLAVLTAEDAEPTGQEDFINGTATLFLLDSADVAVVAAVPGTTTPAGNSFVTWAQLRAYIASLPAATSSTVNVIDVTKAPYYADPTGETDCSAAIDQAIYDALPKTGLDRIMMTDYGTGYVTAPAVSFTGMCTDAIAPTAVAILAADRVGIVEITDRGANIRIIGRYASVTNGSAVVVGGGGGALRTEDLTTGMAADAEIFPAGTTILSITPGVSITLSANATATDAYCPCAFGTPRVVFTGGSGTGAAAETICGDGTTLLFPPGTYATGLGWYLMGNHNLTISGHGARIYVTGTNPSAFAVWGFCRAVDIEGFVIDHQSDVYSNYVSRGNGFSVKYQGSYGRVSKCQSWQAPNFAFGFGRGDNTTAGRARLNRIEDCRSWQACGDGLHIGTGVLGFVAKGHESFGCGDDSIAVVADYGSGNEPEDVVIDGSCRVKNGGFRGLVLIGAINVKVGPLQIDTTRGYGIETSNQYGPDCRRISITGAQVSNVGSASAPGDVLSDRHGILLKHVTEGRVADCQINGATGWGIYAEDLTDVDIGLNSIINCTSGNITRAGTLTDVTQLFYDAGALKYIGAGGTATTIAAS